eukprot:1105173-Prymnesium_polylepis.2
MPPEDEEVQHHHQYCAVRGHVEIGRDAVLEWRVLLPPRSLNVQECNAKPREGHADAEDHGEPTM